MHQTAYTNAEKFYSKYGKGGEKVLDVGALDVNGCLKPIFAGCDYTGVDMVNGENVNVISSSHDLPFADSSFDMVISSSFMEHDDMFWVTFKEMCRVCKPGGYVYNCVPSSGVYHPYPFDSWRFLKDIWQALEKWVKGMKLLESYVDTIGPWKDCIGVFQKEL